MIPRIRYTSQGSVDLSAEQHGPPQEEETRVCVYTVLYIHIRDISADYVTPHFHARASKNRYRPQSSDRFHPLYTLYYIYIYIYLLRSLGKTVRGNKKKRKKKKKLSRSIIASAAAKHRRDKKPKARAVAPSRVVVRDPNHTHTYTLTTILCRVELGLSRYYNIHFESFLSPSTSLFPG